MLLVFQSHYSLTSAVYNIFLVARIVNFFQVSLRKENMLKILKCGSMLKLRTCSLTIHGTNKILSYFSMDSVFAPSVDTS
jgi:hypothetical protein